MIVDIHMHFDRNIDVTKIVKAAKEVGIDKLCCLPLATYGHTDTFEYQLKSEEVKKIMDAHPEVVGFHPGSCLDPKGIEDLEKSVKQLGFRGMKIHGAPDWPIEGLLACHSLLRKAGEWNVPIVIHPSNNPKINAATARHCPNTTFIFAHVGYHWEEAFQAAKPYENACFDTAGYDSISGVVERGVEILGPERIFYGSDAPIRNFVSQLAKVQYADIGKKDRELILGGNATRILNLS